MKKSSFYIINKPEVIAEVIEGELVAIHLGTGCYYHANSSGGQIWQLMEAGYTGEQISAWFEENYKLKATQVNDIVESFFQMMIQEELIRPHARKMKNNQSVVVKNTVKSFEKPILQKHEDMKELLLLDPIHDIGDQEIPMETVNTV